MYNEITICTRLHIEERLEQLESNVTKETEQARKATSNVSIEEQLEQLESNVTKETQEIKAAIGKINATPLGAMSL